MVVAFALLVLALAVAWNGTGEVLLQTDGEYGGGFATGPLEGARFDRNGVDLVTRWVEEDARPVVDPFRILWHQFWYNAFTSGYDQVIWIESGDRIAGPQYALYQKGGTVFLRIEYRGKNRVLHADWEPKELAEALRPHLLP